MVVVTGTVNEGKEVEDLTTRREFGGYGVYRFLSKTRFSRGDFRATIRRAIEEKEELAFHLPISLTLRSFDESNTILVNKERERLTLAEFEVLAKLITGDLNQEISMNLNLTVNTIKSHVKSILAKLQVDNRSKILPFILKIGLIQ